MDEKTISIPGWKIIRTIGKGSFGTVYEVEKEDEFGGGIRSALKVITIPESSSEIEAYRDDGYDDESMTKLFRSRVEDITSEFRLMSKLKGCRNIVSYEDHTIVQHENNPGYDVFIRMELLRPLPKYMDQGSGKSTFDDKTVQKLGVDICRALERCSQHGIIHRDIKPQNIFVNDDGDYKLGDFGVAKTSDHTTRATKTGTFGYMAPEVYWGKPYNASVDLYSLGLVMYWMLNERRGPFIPLPPEVPTPALSAEALDRRMHGEPLPTPKHGSEALKRIILRACAFDPKDRYANPTEMKRELERLAVEAVAEEPHAEPKQKNIPFTADDDEKTFGVFGGRSSTPEEPQVEDDEKTFGVFGGRPSTPEEPPVEDDEKTFGVFGARQPKEPEPVPADDEATVSVKEPAQARPAEKPVEQKKETKPVEPKKETKPVRTEPEQKEKPVETKPAEKKQQKTKSKLPIILSIAAAAVIAAVVLIVVFAGKGKKPSQVAEQPTTESVVTSSPTPESELPEEGLTGEEPLDDGDMADGSEFDDIVDIAQMIFAAGEGGYKKNEFYSKEMYDAYWAEVKTAWMNTCRDIVDFVADRYLTEVFVSVYFGTVFTCDDIASNDGLKIAYGMTVWGFGSFQNGYFTNGINQWNLNNSFPTIEDYYEATYKFFKGDAAAFWETERPGGPYGPSVRDCADTSFINNWIAESSLTEPKIASFHNPAFETAFREQYRLTGTIYATTVHNASALDLYNCGFGDYSDIAMFTGLTRLNLSNTQFSDFYMLKDLTNLEQLGLDANQIVDLTPLKDLTNLTELDLGHNQIVDLTPLKGLTNLTELYLSENRISDVTPLKSLTNLTILFLGTNQIADLTPLKGLTNLEQLYLGYNPITDITPLKGLTNLERLFLSQNRIRDVSPLKSLTNLTELGLDYNSITDVTPLKGLTNLTWLILAHNQISDVSMLKELTNLRTLYLAENPISEQAMNELKAALPNCYISY